MLNQSGYNVKAISYEEWQRNLLASTLEGNALKALEYLFRDSEDEECSMARRYADLKPKVDTSNTLALQKTMNIKCPVIDKDVLVRYVDNLKRQIES